MPNILEQYQQAKKLYKNKNDKASLEILNQLLTTDPQFLPAYFLRASCHAKLGNEAAFSADIAAVLDRDFEKSDLLDHTIFLEGPGYARQERSINEIIMTQLGNLGIEKYASLETMQVRRAKELFLHAVICIATTSFGKMLEDVNALDAILPGNPLVRQLQVMVPAMIAEQKFEEEINQYHKEREEQKSSASLQMEVNSLKDVLAVANQTMTEQQERIIALEAEVKRLRLDMRKPNVNQLFSRSDEDSVLDGNGEISAATFKSSEGFNSP